MVPIPNLRLKGRIYGAGLTQKRLAFALGVSEPYVSNVLNGYEKPSQKFIRHVCLLLGEKVEELFPNHGNLS